MDTKNWRLSADSPSLLASRLGPDRTILLIGYGNELRRDDGAGPLLARRLARTWETCDVSVHCITCQQLTPELADDMAQDDVAVVVFVDTGRVMTGSEGRSVTIHPLLTHSISPSVGHHLDPTALLAYTRALYGKQPPIWLITIPGFDFGHGSGLSQMTEQAVSDARRRAIELLIQITTPLRGVAAF